MGSVVNLHKNVIKPFSIPVGIYIHTYILVYYSERERERDRERMRQRDREWDFAQILYLSERCVTFHSRAGQIRTDKTKGVSQPVEPPPHLFWPFLLVNVPVGHKADSWQCLLERTDSVEQSISNNHQDHKEDKPTSVSLSFTGDHPSGSKSSDRKSTPRPP